MIDSWGWGLGESHEGCIIGPSQGGFCSLSKLRVNFGGAGGERERERERERGG